MPKMPPSIRTEWDLDPDFLTVNHGSFGATPHSVTAAQRAWQDRMERQPSRFMSTVYPDAIREAADALGRSSTPTDVTSRSSATRQKACNAVLRAFRGWRRTTR